MTTKKAQVMFTNVIENHPLGVDSVSAIKQEFQSSKGYTSCCSWSLLLIRCLGWNWSLLFTHSFRWAITWLHAWLGAQGSGGPGPDAGYGRIPAPPPWSPTGPQEGPRHPPWFSRAPGDTSWRPSRTYQRLASWRLCTEWCSRATTTVFMTYR